MVTGVLRETGATPSRHDRIPRCHNGDNCLQLLSIKIRDESCRRRCR